MKKLVFPFVEIEVPDDFPSGLDPEATFKYADQHPEVAAKICREYERAYRKWKKSQDKTHAKKSKSHKAEARSPQISAESINDAL
jgi:DNA repair ATPase RecN